MCEWDGCAAITKGSDRKLQHVPEVDMPYRLLGKSIPAQNGGGDQRKGLEVVGELSADHHITKGYLRSLRELHGRQQQGEQFRVFEQRAHQLNPFPTLARIESTPQLLAVGVLQAAAQGRLQKSSCN
jgi:hypothetical protein